MEGNVSGVQKSEVYKLVVSSSGCFSCLKLADLLVFVRLLGWDFEMSGFCIQLLVTFHEEV